MINKNEMYVIQTDKSSDFLSAHIMTDYINN